MLNWAGFHVDPSSVCLIQNWSVELLVEGNIKNFIGWVGDVETRHPYHEHESSFWAGGEGEAARVGLVLSFEGGGYYLLPDCFEAHVGEEYQKDSDDNYGSETTGGCGVLTVTIVAHESWGGEEVNVSESFCDVGKDCHLDLLKSCWIVIISFSISLGVRKSIW